ncbi:MAG: hypothetical protein MJ135_02865 [Oscillospiraceae bacterium]|nr:hypothetical protein [Oscillospiraceae bacterium]
MNKETTFITETQTPLPAGSAEVLSLEQMLADTEALLNEYAKAYRRMAA